MPTKQTSFSTSGYLALLPSARNEPHKAWGEGVLLNLRDFLLVPTAQTAALSRAQ